MAKEQSSSLEGIEHIPLEVFVERAYLDYSMYVILDRALPHLADGLKPVQRRIIYAMSELGLSNMAKYKKSARTVGDVLGKYHPHGDSACYEAMVLMAQPFAYRYPLIDGQGNFGSQDDPKSFAAMRYTEARLTPYSQMLLEELEEGTVKWLPNFDGTLTEPALLPAQFPNILLNGSSGIAVGMATDIPPHNLTEVGQALIYLLEHLNATLDDLIQIIPGPDFPTGGEIITSKEDIQNMYEKGVGSIRSRAVYRQEDHEIIIDALPYQISGAKVVEQIAQQMQLKKLPMLVDVRDEGDHEHANRIVLELRSNRVDVEPLLSHLFATTDLEHTVRVNLNVIGINGRPEVKNLLTLLKEWLEYRIQTVRQRLNHRLLKAKDRLHVLEGLLIVFLNLDEIIAIIRYDDHPEKKLMERFNLSEKQVHAILETKLRHLAKLEEKKIKLEQKALSNEINSIEKILASPNRLKKLVGTEIKALIKRFGDTRRCAIEVRSQAQVLSATEIIPSEPVTIILSKKGWVRMAKGHEMDGTKLNYRTGDECLTYLKSLSEYPVVFLDQSGRAYTLPTSQLPSARGVGAPLSAKFTLTSGTDFLGMVMGKETDFCLFSQDHGYGFLVPLLNLYSKNKSGKAIMNLKSKEKMLTPLLISNFEETDYLAAFTQQGYLLLFPLRDVPVLVRGRGNKLIQLPLNSGQSKDHLIFLVALKENDSLEIYSQAQKFVLNPASWKRYISERALRGSKLPRGLKQITKISVISPLSS